MKLKDLFKDINIDIEINGISTNTRTIKDGDLFVCIKGANFDRHDFIEEAVLKDAKAIVVSKDIKTTVPTIKVEDPDQELIRLLKVYYDNPQDKLIVIGTTGTDGKTTTAKVIQQLLGNDKCAFIGTLGADFKDFTYKTSNTTPPPEILYYLFNKFVENGIKYVSMEASSEANFYHRLDGLTFDFACLTNITSEHLNTHKTLENYISCKKELFINSKNQILNSNDLHFEEVKAVSNNYVTYGTNKENLVRINSYTLYPNRTEIDLNVNDKNYLIKSSLLGKFNVENLALAICLAYKLGINISEIIDKCKSLVIPGRMQVINLGQNFHCICDYAHTANAVKNVLEFANTLDVNRIITVIGQAGGRDHEKRKYVGKSTLDLSDYAILTMDDPRFEKVEDTIKDMLELTDKTNYEIIIDRPQAIQKAIDIAKENDLLLFLGKGVDPYMAIEDRRDYYLETEEIEKALKKRLGINS